MSFYLTFIQIFGWLNKKEKCGLCIFTSRKQLKKIKKYVKI